MKNYVKKLIREYVVCQENKASTTLLVGLLQPLLIQGAWVDILMILGRVYLDLMSLM